MLRAALPFAALTLLPVAALGAPTPRLAAMPTAGPPPLMVAFDTSRTAAAAVAEHLLFVGDGDALLLQTAAEMPSYGYQLPGSYLAQSWLREADGGFATSAPLAISVSRLRDGRSPPTVELTVAATTDALTYAFMPTVTAAADDEVVAHRWEFGDGASSGEEAPFHTYAHAGLYQAELVATSQSGLAAFARVLVAVDGGAGLLPSLLVAVTPEDASPLTPVRVSAFVEGASGAKVTSADVAWPDIDDAAPAVTPTMAGITVSSDHGFTRAGYYDVVVTVQLDGASAPLTAVAHVMVANPDGSPPSPLLLAAQSGEATVDQPYLPGGASGSSLPVGGVGPFAFGAAAPSPSNFSVDDHGNVLWTPTRAQLGTQRLAVRVVDADGHEMLAQWVVHVAGSKKSGCATVPGAPSGGAGLLLAVALLALGRRRLTG